ncbi:hypothetical protein E2320_012049 [Naja naja]|nr:hypothetical protein E2320_012049 [Naja naja]
MFAKIASLQAFHNNGHRSNKCGISSSGFAVQTIRSGRETQRRAFRLMRLPAAGGVILPRSLEAQQDSKHPDEVLSRRESDLRLPFSRDLQSCAHPSPSHHRCLAMPLVALHCVVFSLQDLCCRAIVSCTPVHLIDKLPLPVTIKSHLKSFSMANGMNAVMMHGRSYSLASSGGGSGSKGNSLKRSKSIRPPQSPPQNCSRNNCKIS